MQHTKQWKLSYEATVYVARDNLLACFLNEGLQGRDDSNMLQAIEDYMYDINEGKYQQKLYDHEKH